MIDHSSHILLTGATGFLGGYVLRTLLKFNYHQITCTHRASSDFTLIQDVKDNVKWKLCDLTDELDLAEALTDVDIVIHVAAKVSLSNKNRAAVMFMNVEVTANMINASLNQEIQKFIFVSSVAALGVPNEGELIHEETEWVDRPEHNAYCISKQRAEREVMRGVAEGLNASIISPAMVIGAGFWDSSSVSIVKSIYNRLPFYPIGSIGVVDVRDVALMIVKILERSDVSGEKYIASSENWDHKKIIDFLCKEFGKEPTNRALTPLLTKLSIYGARLGELILGENAIVNAEAIRFAQHRFKFDNSKSVEQLNFQYREVQLSFQEIANVFKQSFLKGEPYGILDI